MINTHIQVDLVSSIALEHAVSMVDHPLLDTYEVFPGKAIELNFKIHAYDNKDKYLGVDRATFRCQMLKRQLMGYKVGLPIQWDEHCFMLQQFVLKEVALTNKSKKQQQLEDWWELFEVVMADIRANIPEAIYDTGTETWWIGDKGFNTTAGVTVTR